jgi:flavin-binding protein dodecin
MTHQVRRDIEAVGTANAASEGAAKTSASEAVVDAIESSDDGLLVSVEVVDSSVYDFPAAPFDPYRFHLRTRVVVSVGADDEASAQTAGSDAIDDLLDRADLDEWEYASDAELEAPA